MDVADTELTKTHIVSALKLAPGNAASDESLQEIFVRRGIDTTRRQVRHVCDTLVMTGTVEVASQKGDSKRYRLMDNEAT